MEGIDVSRLDLKVCGRMMDADCNARIYLPKDIRNQIGITPHQKLEVFIVGDNEGLYIKLLDKKEN